MAWMRWLGWSRGGHGIMTAGSPSFYGVAFYGEERVSPPQGTLLTEPEAQGTSHISSPVSIPRSSRRQRVWENQKREVGCWSFCITGEKIGGVGATERF